MRRRPIAAKPGFVYAPAMVVHSFLIRVLAMLLVAALLTACAGLRRIDSEVSTFTRWAGASGISGAPGTTYRFERLPSQEGPAPVAGELSQDQLEAAARQVLERRGLVHAPDAALLIVQLGRTRVVQPAGYGGWNEGPGVMLGAGTAGSFIGLSFPLIRHEPPLFVRELSLVMRDSRSNAVLYETRARHSGSWDHSTAIWPAMLEAALEGFPQPAQAVRRVKVEVPR